jgi:hypothetical protein
VTYQAIKNVPEKLDNPPDTGNNQRGTCQERKCMKVAKGNLVETLRLFVGLLLLLGLGFG